MEELIDWLEERKREAINNMERYYKENLSALMMKCDVERLCYQKVQDKIKTLKTSDKDFTASPKVCPNCNGTGIYQIYGQSGKVKDCPKCKGSGKPS